MSISTVLEAENRGAISRATISADVAGSLRPTTSTSAHEIALGAAYTHGTDADRRRLGTMLTDLLHMVAEGTIDPMLVHQLSLEQVPQALGALSRHELTGKAVFVARPS